MNVLHSYTRNARLNAHVARSRNTERLYKLLLSLMASISIRMTYSLVAEASRILRRAFMLSSCECSCFNQQKALAWRACGVVL
eukprot:6207167-Pleurochrysis_carterae.AAC.1